MTVSDRKHLGALLRAEVRRWDDLRQADHKALETALQRSKEMLDLHNNIIRASERKEATYVTRGQVFLALGTVLTAIAVGYTIFG